MKWHDYPEEFPDKTGEYLVLMNIDEDVLKAGDGRPFGAVDILKFYAEGDKIEIYSPELYKDLSPEQRLVKLMSDPYTVQSTGAFYEVLNDGTVYTLHEVTHWAELPEVPECYAGNQNDYAEEPY